MSRPVARDRFENCGCVLGGRFLPDEMASIDDYDAAVRKSLVQEFGVARGTVRRAIEVLRDAGLVVTVQGRGTFVKS